jgi:hypothetical protein
MDAGRLDSHKVLGKFHRNYDDNLARTNKLNALPYDILTSEEVITLLVERHMRFFSTRGIWWGEHQRSPQVDRNWLPENCSSLKYPFNLSNLHFK